MPDVRPRVLRLHGQGQLPPEALPAQHDAALGRGRDPQPQRPDQRRARGARRGPGVTGQPRHRHQRGRRGRGDAPRLQVRPGQRDQPRPPAPDHHRRRGHPAGAGCRRLPRRRRRLRRRGLELRRHRLPLLAREPRRQDQHPPRRRRADRVPVPHQGPVPSTTSATRPRPRRCSRCTRSVTTTCRPVSTPAACATTAWRRCISHVYDLGLHRGRVGAADQGLRGGALCSCRPRASCRRRRAPTRSSPRSTRR